MVNPWEQKARKRLDQQLAREIREQADRRVLDEARPVRLRLGGELSPPREGWKRIGQNVLDDGRLLVAWARDGFGISEYQSKDGSIKRHEIRTGEASDIAVVIHDSGVTDQLVTLRHSAVRFPKIDLLPEGGILVVDCRCVPNPDGTLVENASIFNLAGDEIGSFHVGDGVREVQCTPRGRIWVGYGDEGVFGNSRWRELLDGPAPSSSGLAQFGQSGELLWCARDDPSISSITDIYALNVTGEVAWNCPDSDYPVLKIESGVTTTWSCHVIGASALLVRENIVALVGGYWEFRHQRIVVGELTANGFVTTEVLRLEKPDGSKLEPRARVMGRGDQLWVVTETRFYKLSISEMLN